MQSANRQIQTKRRAPKTAWKPGQSGNPRGRPKIDRHVRNLARQYTQEAIEALADIMRDETETASARARAAEAILDRGWGRPAPSEAHEMKNAHDEVDHRSEEEIDARIKQLMHALYDDDPLFSLDGHSD